MERWSSSHVKHCNEKLVRLAILHIVASYHRVFSLDGFDLQAVLHSFGGAVGFYCPVCPPATFTAPIVLSIALGRLPLGGPVSTLLLGDVGLGTVDSLDVFPQGAGIRVTLCAPWDLTYVRFLFWGGYRERGSSDQASSGNVNTSS